MILEGLSFEGNPIRLFNDICEILKWDKFEIVSGVDTADV
jgi:hypothetical protein